MRARKTSRYLAGTAGALFAAVSSYAFADPVKKPDTSTKDLSEAQRVEFAPLYAPLTPEAQALREYLNFDPARSMLMMPAAPLRSATNSATPNLDWNRTDKTDGSSAVSVKRPVPLEWSSSVDAKVGADFGLAPEAGTNYRLDRPLPAGKDQSSGSAWANVTMPGFASIDARVDPSKDQSKLGTTFSRSLPVGNQYSVTLLNSYALTEQLGRTPGNGITGVGTAPAPTQVWSTDRMVKFNILSTGTSLAAGTTISTVDNVTRNKIMAEQKLFDSLSITTAVTDVGGSAPSKSISAGFKLKW